MKVYREHLQVIDTLYKDGQITRQAKKTLRGQVLSLQTTAEREDYLQRVIRNLGKGKSHARCR